MAKECALCGRKFGFMEDSYPIAGTQFSYCKSHREVWDEINRAIHEDPDFAVEDAVDLTRGIVSSESDTFRTAVLAIARNVKSALSEEDMEQYRKEKMIREEEKRLSEADKKVMLTTGSHFDGWSVVKYIDILCDEFFYKNGFFTMVEANIADAPSSFSWSSYELSGSSDLIEEAKKASLKRFRRKAAYAGANAVLGVKIGFDISDSVVRVSISGTAVEIAKE